MNLFRRIAGWSLIAFAIFLALSILSLFILVDWSISSSIPSLTLFFIKLANVSVNLHLYLFESLPWMLQAGIITLLIGVSGFLLAFLKLKRAVQS